MDGTEFKYQKGYTLVEALIVLSIFFIILSITVLSFKPLIRQLQINDFFEQLQLDIAYSQYYALSHNRDVHIKFSPDHYSYEITSGFTEPSLIHRSYSKNIDLQLVTLPATVTFLSNGTIKRAGKMNISYDDELYSFVFLFGKGQTYVEKL